MTFTINREDIFPIIKQAKAFISNSPFGLEFMKFKIRNKILTIQAQNGVHSFSSTLKVDAENVEFYVDGKTIFDTIITMTKGSYISFNVDKELNITDGSSENKINLSDLPFNTPKFKQTEYSLHLSSKELLMYLNRVYFAISNNATKIEYTGLHLLVRKEYIKFISADYMMIAETELQSKNEEEFSYNIPKYVISELIKILKFNEICEVTIECNALEIQFKINNIIVYTKLIERYIKSIDKLFTYEYPVVIKLNRGIFTKTVTQMLDKDFNSSHVTRFNFTTKNLNNKSKTVEIPFEIIAEPAFDQFFFNAKQMLDILNHFDSRYVILRMSGSKQPIIIQPDIGNYKSLLAPLSVEEIY